MAWGYRLKKLTKKEKDLCRVLSWGCGGRSCSACVEYISTYSYVSSHGNATHAKRPFCPAHARLFAMRYTLAWPAGAGKVRIRLPPLPAASRSRRIAA